MIPDKIYTFQDDGDRYWYKPEEWETPPLTRVEYIRKDALLEWLKDRQKHYRKRADDIADISNPDLPFFEGKENTFTEVIDKIESL